jgi:hypothetical protein
MRGLNELNQNERLMLVGGMSVRLLSCFLMLEFLGGSIYLMRYLGKSHRLLLLINSCCPVLEWQQLHYFEQNSPIFVWINQIYSWIDYFNY